METDNIIISKFNYIFFNYKNFDPFKYILIENTVYNSYIDYNNIGNTIIKKLHLTYNKDLINKENKNKLKNGLYFVFRDIKLNTNIFKPYNSQTHDILHFNEKLVISYDVDELEDGFCYFDFFDNSNILKNDIVLLDKKDENYKHIYELFKKIDEYMIKNIDKLLNSDIIKDLCKVNSYKLIYNELCNSEKENYIDTNLDKIYNKTDLNVNNDYLKVSINNTMSHSFLVTINTTTNKRKIKQINNNEISKYLYDYKKIDLILDLSRLYFTIPTNKINPIINFGILPVLKQITINKS